MRASGMPENKERIRLKRAFVVRTFRAADDIQHDVKFIRSKSYKI